MFFNILHRMTGYQHDKLIESAAHSVSNWGNYPKVQAQIFQSDVYEQIATYVKEHNGLIARGNGRCYGDSSLAQKIFSTARLNRILSVSTEKKTLTCQSGTLFSEILDEIVPKGFFLPVVPGTKYISMGGAVAADIHGKNHHKEGSFSRYLIELTLMLQDGSIVKCSPKINQDLFWKTCGGMGLTGIILEVTIGLKPITSPYIRQRTIRTKNLEETLLLFDEYADYTYSVAWIDCVIAGKNLGRSILFLGEHADLLNTPALKQNHKRPLLNIPFYLPSFILGVTSITAFNLLYYHLRKSDSASQIHYDPFFFPLDRIQNWNRIYGKKGFTQYQFVIPKDSGKTLRQIINAICSSGETAFLGVLKAFGKGEDYSYMSFPEEGWTLALDFKISASVFKLLNNLDSLVKDAGGKLYLAKDSRMSKEMFQSTYKKYITSNHFRSLQSDRLTH